MTTYHIYVDGVEVNNSEHVQVALATMQNLSAQNPGKTVHVDEHRTIAHYYTPLNKGD